MYMVFSRDSNLHGILKDILTKILMFMVFEQIYKVFY